MILFQQRQNLSIGIIDIVLRFSSSYLTFSRTKHFSSSFPRVKVQSGEDFWFVEGTVPVFIRQDPELDGESSAEGRDHVANLEVHKFRLVPEFFDDSAEFPGPPLSILHRLSARNYEFATTKDEGYCPWIFRSHYGAPRISWDYTPRFYHAGQCGEGSTCNQDLQ